jgi:subtilisin family serine protease
MRKAVMCLGTVVLLLVGSSTASGQSVIITCIRPCTSVVEAVESNGGVVTFRYKYVDAIAADLRGTRALNAVRQLVEPAQIRKDFNVELPPTDGRTGSIPPSVSVEAGTATPLDAPTLATAGADPAAYLINNVAMNLAPLHGNGILGQGMKVAVIDSGLRPNFPHLTLDGSVIGGEDFVGDGLGFSNAANNGHGTFVAGMISANAAFLISGALRAAISTHCPSCVTPITPTTSLLPVVGSAPSSSIYAVRVFGPTGGAPESRIIAAMERVLELRENYDNGMPETQNANGSYNALNIQVCNMSLGGTTFFAGRDIEDQLTKEFLEKDVVLVVAAGNAGPSGMTGGSPGTGFDSLTVGASSSAVHERILRDVQFGAGVGALYRPFGGTQTAYFSSRGPTADGRVDPELVANGFASFGQGLGTTTTSLSIASGTSFATPSVSGVAAVLRQAVPNATARQVRNAIFMAANPSLLADGSGPFDRGWGHVDAGAALQLLQSFAAPDLPGIEGRGKESVRQNVMHIGIPTFSGQVTRSVEGLKPGQRFETFYLVPKDTSAITITLSDVVPRATQNPLFGDDILLTVHTAKTSQIGEGDYLEFNFTKGKTITIPNPDEGLMRVTVSGDWTNASPIGATITVSSDKTPTPGKSAHGKIDDGETLVYTFDVPAGTARLDAELEWDNDWSAYPTNDVDLLLVPPAGPPNLAGATINAPERAGIDNPVAGEWTAIVDGFSVLTGKADKFSLRLRLDGHVIKVAK